MRAGVGIRFLAFLIDFIFMLVISFVVTISFLAMAPGTIVPKAVDAAGQIRILNSDKNAVVVLSLTLSAILQGYMFMEVLFSRTMGKLICGLCIRDLDGGKAPFTSLFIRYLLKNSPQLLGLVYTLTGIFGAAALTCAASFVLFFGCFMVFGSQKQTLYDKMALVAVYYTRSLGATSPQQAQALVRPAPISPAQPPIDFSERLKPRW